ncbi:hypothetical protein V5F40_22900 [Xanthobacter sp. DSM 14520]|uniref:hypothetical protein n=1 Tax=Xanthobacter autotrophicus (strain ATCC BAA-1158 / Py2) TaxID=78245 RepID=UPI00372AFB09
MPKQPKRTFKVTVQFRDVRTITVRAGNPAEAVEKASKRVERSGAEVIACLAEPAGAATSN